MFEATLVPGLDLGKKHESPLVSLEGPVFCPRAARSLKKPVVKALVPLLKPGTLWGPPSGAFFRGHFTSGSSGNISPLRRVKPLLLF